jgi:hypothetical protein
MPIIDSLLGSPITPRHQWLVYPARPVSLRCPAPFAGLPRLPYRGVRRMRLIHGRSFGTNVRCLLRLFMAAPLLFLNTGPRLETGSRILV